MLATCRFWSCFGGFGQSVSQSQAVIGENNQSSPEIDNKHVNKRRLKNKLATELVSDLLFGLKSQV